MTQVKLFIKNRNQKKICILVDKVKHPKGIVVLAHGLGVTKEWETITIAAESFIRENYLVIRFDARDTYGESEGNPENATITSYLRDLDDVVKWTEKQPWFKKPFILLGHSIGSVGVIKYALKHPSKITSTISIATVVSGKLTLQLPAYSEWRLWKKKGWREYRTSEGILKRRIRWNHYANRLRYDLLKDAKHIKTPTLLIAGSKDVVTPVAHHKLLFDKITAKKKLIIIKDAKHDIIGEKQAKAIHLAIASWIKEEKS